MLISPLDIHRLLDARVLSWLDEMRIPGQHYRYRYAAGSGDSVFTSCFAIFLLDLLRRTDILSVDIREGWADHLNSFQSAEDGLFYPNPIFHPDRERAVFQCTSFCLSALSILGAAPVHPLRVAEQWLSQGRVEAYLHARGCHAGRGSSGNKAMFQGILLTAAYEQCGDPRYLDAIEEWFRFHDRAKNAHGFWGTNLASRYYHGVQNGFHQFVIYEYWNRPFGALENAVRAVLAIQDNLGFFAATRGGSACPDYDAIHMLVAARAAGLRSERLDGALERAFEGVSSALNDDGGFCDSRYSGETGLRRLLSDAGFVIRAQPQIAYLRALATAREYRSNGRTKWRKWVPEARPRAASTLWDSWFRALALAEISEAFQPSGLFRFQRHVGIGYSPSSSNETLSAPEAVVRSKGGGTRSL